MAIPASPHFYVASIGNDGVTHTGLVSDPLLTVAEALRRLAVTGWTGQPIITVVDTLVNQGTNITWNVPAPIGGASVYVVSVIQSDTLANNNLLEVRSSTGTVIRWSGTNPLALVPLITTQASRVQIALQPTVTGGGGAGANEVKIGANAATTWALAFGGLAVNSTDMAHASSSMCRVGP